MMADFLKAFNKLKGIEFSTPDDALHKNKGENGLTYYGIYQSAHPHWNGWSVIMAYLMTHNFDRHLASIEAYHNEQLTQEVMGFYYMNFWLPLRLDDVRSQKIAEEMFFFHIHTGDKKRASRYAQAIVGAKADGVIGNKSIIALNGFDEKVFDMQYDNYEIRYYKTLVANNPKRFKRYIKGFINRAKLI